MLSEDKVQGVAIFTCARHDPEMKAKHEDEGEEMGEEMIEWEVNMKSCSCKANVGN